MQIKVTSMAEMEAKLDKQLEEILGKSVAGNDLEMFYELDLKLLGSLILALTRNLIVLSNTL